MCLISVLKDGDSAREEVSFYDGSLKDEALIDWIWDIERYFEHENVQDYNRVHFSTMKSRGHVAFCIERKSGLFT
jgi:hypothetical protein